MAPGRLTPTQPRSKDRRADRASRLPELGRIESVGTEPPCRDTARSDGRGEGPPAVAQGDLVNVFPEPAMLPEPAASASKKAAKGGGRLFKKNRWSNSKPSVVAV